MIEAGYSKQTSLKPSLLGKGFAELIEKALPDSHLLKKHKEFLNAPRLVRSFRKGELETEVEETDPSAVKALDMAYKLKGKYSTEGGTNNILIVNVTAEAANKYGIRKTNSGTIEDPQ